MFSGLLDTTCPHDTAQEYAKKIGDDVVYFETWNTADHFFWPYASDEEFMNLLVAQLQPPTSDLELEFLS